MSDKLIAIESKNWTALRDLYSSSDPNTIYSHCTVDNYIQWLGKEPHAVDWIFYSLNGDWSDGTFAVVVSGYYLICRILLRARMNIKCYRSMDAHKCDES